MIKYLLTIVLLSFVGGGCCQCSSRNIGIGAAPTGKVFEGKREWRVAVVNHCSNCTQLGIVMSCPGFQSVYEVDVHRFVQVGDRCLVDEGRPLTPNAHVEFTYAWDPPFHLSPKSSAVQCT